MRDPFEEEIIARLDGPLDDKVFEACACDLLRDAHPSLAPIPGGSDSGMDGMIAEGAGVTLVATTQQDPLDNLKRSLASQVAHGGVPGDVVLATSRRLTPRRVRNLNTYAQSQGFRLLNVYQQQAFVDRLYHCQRWCLKLLDLASDPPALSTVPSGARSLVDLALVGQEEVLAGVRDCSGDRVLAGPPGSGKTFLLYQLVRQGLGLFVESDDAGRIAAELRRQHPRVVVVDDAHVHMDRLETLSSLRKADAGFAFEIIATTWEGEDEAAVLGELGIPSEKVFKLPKLTRDQLVEVVHAVGLRGTNRLIREIVDQAANRPGLAVTLAHLCLNGGAADVLYGRALSRTLIARLTRRIGDEAADVLAVLAVGGKSGMPMRAVCEFLRRPPAEVRRLLARLAPAGVIAPAGDGFTVRPRALRFALVRDYFFDQTQPRLDLEPLIPAVPDAAEMVLTLVGAAHRGATLPAEKIRPLLVSHGSREAWDAYAALGTDEAQWALDQQRDVAWVAQGALAGNPAVAVSRLLTAATRDEHPLEAEPKQLLQILSDWLSDLEVVQAHPAEWQRRHQVAADAIVRWLRTEGGDPAVAVKAFCLVLSPEIRASSSDPGKGMTVTISQGIVGTAEIRTLEAFWPQLLGFLDEADPVPWKPLERLLSKWADPHHGLLPGSSLSEATRSELRTFAGQMVRDLAARWGNRPGIGLRLRRYGQALGVEVSTGTDPLLELFCPQERWAPEDWHHQWERHGQRVDEAAAEWAKEEPNAAMQRLLAAVRSAREAGLRDETWTYRFCYALAEHTGEPLDRYVQALLEPDPPEPQLARPFLDRMIRNHDAAAIDLARTCLRSAAYGYLGFIAALTHQDAPQDLIAEALEQAPRYARVVEVLCLQRQVPVVRARALLEHADIHAALAAAEGEWNGGSKAVRQELAEAWRAACLRAPASDDTGFRLGDGTSHFLTRVFAADSGLAFEWLQLRIAEPAGYWYFAADEHGPIPTALSKLTTQQRLMLLDLVPRDAGWQDFIAHLVGDDTEVYAILLRDPTRDTRATPLRGGPGGAWPQKAAMALAAGIAPRDIAWETLMGGGFSFAGSEAAFWQEKVHELERALAGHPDLEPVLEAAREITEGRIQRARDKERAIELFGPEGPS